VSNGRSHALRRSIELVTRHAADGTLLAVSPSFREVLGYAPEEVVGTSSMALVHPDDVDRVVAALQDCLRGARRQLEFRARHKSGHIAWLEAVAEPCLSPDGDGAIDVLVRSRDVTHRHAAEAVERESERRFRMLAERALDLISRHAPDGRFIYASDAAVRLLGYQPSELIGANALDLIHPDDRRQVVAVLAPLARRNAPCEATVTCRLLRKDGSIVWTESTDRLVRDEDGRIVEVQSVTRDISARRAAQEALAESEARFRAVFESSPVGMAFCDADLRFVRVNAAYERLVGYSADELRRRRFTDVTHPDDVSAGRAAARRLFSGEAREWRHDKRYVTRDGEVVPVRVNVVPIDAGGSALTLAIVEDLRDHKAVEAQLRQIAQMKSDFVALVSHDLRAPLTNVLGGLELIAADAATLSACVARTVDIVTQEARRLQRLVESILDVAKLDAGELRMQRRPLDLAALIHRLASEVAPAEDRTAFAVALPASLPPVLADETYLSQALANVMANAVRFSPVGRPVEVRATVVRDTVSVTVRDHGPGIAPRDRARVFEPFVRGRRQPPSGHGHGLGLYFARRLLEAQGARIAVDPRTTHGQGACFVIKLPLASDGGD